MEEDLLAKIQLKFVIQYSNALRMSLKLSYRHFNYLYCLRQKNLCMGILRYIYSIIHVSC